MATITNKPKIVELMRHHFAWLCQSLNDLWTQKSLLYMVNCGTGALGWTKFFCKKCEKLETVSNACNNRNCPNCGSQKRALWAEKLSKKLLPVEHFHIVFTIPHEFNSLVFENQHGLLGLLMKASADTLMTFVKNKAEDKKAIPAFVQILHTWTQKLNLHYHVHILMANGYFLDNNWIKGKKGFLFSVRALGAVFKAKFLAGFECLVKEGAINGLTKDSAHATITLLNLPKKWNIYCSPPYNSIDTAIKYCARYANRIGISDSRILAASPDFVEFSCRKNQNEKDPIDTTKQDASKESKSPSGLCKLPTKEFLQRLFQHVLPKGFRKIRLYGLYANATTRLKIAQDIIRTKDKLDKFEQIILPAKRLCKACLEGEIKVYVHRIGLYAATRADNAERIRILYDNSS
jgi:hypothetical protein